MISHIEAQSSRGSKQAIPAVAMATYLIQARGGGAASGIFRTLAVGLRPVRSSRRPGLVAAGLIAVGCLAAALASRSAVLPHSTPPGARRHRNRSRRTARNMAARPRSPPSIGLTGCRFPRAIIRLNSSRSPSTSRRREQRGTARSPRRSLKGPLAEKSARPSSGMPDSFPGVARTGKRFRPEAGSGSVSNIMSNPYCDEAKSAVEGPEPLGAPVTCQRNSRRSFLPPRDGRS